MSTIDTSRPLPVDIRVLRQHWLPSEPESSVTAARQGLARLDELMAAATSRLDDHDRRARERATELADDAIAGRDLSPHELTLGIDERPVLAAALEQLRCARAIVQQQLTRATTSDPIYVDWTRRCIQITDEWREASGNTNPTVMLEFVQRHQPS